MQSEHYRMIGPLPRASNKQLPCASSKLNQVINFNLKFDTMNLFSLLLN